MERARRRHCSRPMPPPRAIPQAGRGLRACWGSTKSSRPEGATCWSIAPANRSRPLRQPAPTNDRRPSRRTGGGLRTCRTRRASTKCMSRGWIDLAKRCKSQKAARPSPSGRAKGCFIAQVRASCCARLTAAFSESRALLFEGHFERDPGSNLAAYDVDPQGRFFIMLKSAWQPREVRVVKNWGSELRLY